MERWRGAALSMRARCNGFGWSSARNRTRAEDFTRHRHMLSDFFDLHYILLDICPLYEVLMLDLLIRLEYINESGSLTAVTAHKTVLHENEVLLSFYDPSAFENTLLKYVF